MSRKTYNLKITNQTKNKMYKPAKIIHFKKKTNQRQTKTYHTYFPKNQQAHDYDTPSKAHNY